MTAVPNELLIVARLIMLKDGAELGTATGFFFRTSTGSFLITNRHVVIDEEENFYPDSLQLRLHTDASDLQKNGDFKLRLYSSSGNAPVWHEHSCGRDVDLVAIPVDREELARRFVVSELTRSQFLPEDLVLGLSHEVMVIGYPKGFHDNVFNLPIVRNASLASAYGVPFKGRPVFLIDALLHRGTSGSPVLTKPQTSWTDKYGGTRFTPAQWFFLGVHSATFVFEIKPDEPTSALNVVWYCSLLEQICPS